MDEVPTLISPEERNRRLTRLVTAAQRALEAMENCASGVGPLGVVDVERLAKELREGLAPYALVGASKPRPLHTSTALAHLSTLTVPRQFKEHDTVRLKQHDRYRGDRYRGIKAGELGKVVKVYPNGKWLDIRWRSYHAHDLTTKASHVELAADA